MAGAVGTVLGLAGSLISTVASARMAARTANASKQAENAREQQMQLEAQRRRRSSIREGILARSMSLSTGVNQGAQFGTGVIGGMQGASSQALENIQTINASEILGSRVFQHNREYHDATAQGQRMMAIGSGISSIGGALASNAGAFERIGGGNSQQGYQPVGAAPPQPMPRFGDRPGSGVGGPRTPRGQGPVGPTANRYPRYLHGR